MKYIDTIVKENKVSTKKKLHKRKIITVAVQKVSTVYIKVYASTNDRAEAIAKSWYETGRNDDKIVKIGGDPAEYLNGPITYGFTTEILGKPIEDMVDLSED
jgi:hypothetical protein